MKVKACLWCPMPGSLSGEGANGDAPIRNGQRRRRVWVTLAPHQFASKHLTMYGVKEIRDCQSGEEYPLESTLALQGEMPDWDALALSQSPEMQSAARGL